MEHSSKKEVDEKLRPGRAELFPLFDSVPVDDVIDEVDPMKLLSSTEQFPGL